MELKKLVSTPVKVPENNKGEIKITFWGEECDKIIKIAHSKGLIQGLTRKNKVDNIRSSKICWLYANDDLDWAFRKVTDIAAALVTLAT